MPEENTTISAGLTAHVDPRLKLMLAVLAIATIFATRSWLLLGLVCLLSGALLARLHLFNILAERLFWLRWFFLFAFLLHLLLSPGHRLFGQLWLSYDGLVQGALVSVQVAAALAVSLLLTRTTSPEQLASAVAALFRPLSFLGLNVEGFASQVLLTLQFVPLLQAEGRTLVETIPQGSGFQARVKRIQRVVTVLFGRLLERADALAVERAQEKYPVSSVARLPALRPLTMADWLAVGSGAALILLGYGLP